MLNVRQPLPLGFIVPFPLEPWVNKPEFLSWYDCLHNLRGCCQVRECAVMIQVGVGLGLPC